MRQYGILIFLFLICFYQATAIALEVEEKQFGFSGQVLIRHVNPVSLKIHNPDNEPYDGTIGLSRGGGFRRSGALIVKEFYLAPHTSQWVHFYPYFQEGENDFSLKWGRGLIQQTLVEGVQPQKTQPLYFSASDAIASGSFKMKRYPVEFFPPMLGATDALKIAILDHNPRWQKVRRQTFRDWVYKGGTLHLFHDSTGQYPEFSEELAEFNMPLNAFAVGGGMVYRHPQTVDSVSKEYVKNKLRTHLEMANSDIANKEEEKETDDQDSVNNLRNNYMYSGYDLNYSNAFFRELRNMTRPEHNWNLIYILSFVYLVAIFPGCLILGRKRVDYKKIYLFILLSAGTMSFLFWKLGQRGYDEKKMYNSVAIAHSLGGNRFDVLGWNSSFVTSGDIYELKNQGEGVIYTTGEDYSRVNGTIVNGTGGMFRVDIPPFTARTYCDHAVFKTENPIIQLKDYETAYDLLKMNLEVTDPLDQVKTLKAQVYYNGKIYRTSNQNGQLSVIPGTGQVLRQYISSKLNSNGRSNFFYNYPWMTNRKEDVMASYQKMNDPLIMYSLGIGGHAGFQEEIENLENDEFRYDSYCLPSGNVSRVFLYASPSPEFKHNDQNQSEIQGRVLYVMDFNLGEKT